ncbi:hypothetical protein GCM10009525_67200 [Streptosporangium amethystogenes subsp. fukuiense]
MSDYRDRADLLLPGQHLTSCSTLPDTLTAALAPERQTSRTPSSHLVSSFPGCSSGSVNR